MEDKHRDLIARNFSSLVEQADLDQLVPILLEKGVFSAQMIDPYLDQMKDRRSRKRRLFRDIERRGPHAFGKLLEALNEIGHWDLVRLLDPNHSLHGRPPVISLKNANRVEKSHLQIEKESPIIPNSEPPLNENGNERPESVVPNGTSVLNVIKSSKFMDENDDILCYSTKSKKRGVLFMINNINFDKDIEEIRHGALMDQNNLEELFKQVGFHEFVIRTNLTAQQMWNEILSFVKSDVIKRTDCVFVVMASHGFSKSNTTDTDIRGCDGQNVSAHAVLEQFNNVNCESLQNIPKVFIFQMCRGDAPDYGLSTSSNANSVTISSKPKTQTDGTFRSANTQLRTYSDMLIAHSTIPGFASHRDADNGSWYVQALCEIFAEHSHRRHVEDLFKMVDAKLRDNQHYTKQTSSVDNWGFNKHLYLHPGLFNTSNSTSSFRGS